ncbi:MAG: hypothetical protein ACR2II_10530 [Chthoniobacterales bacterium]
MKKTKKLPSRPEGRAPRKSDEDGPSYLVGGKRITPVQREAEIKRREAKIAQLEKSIRVYEQALGAVNELIPLAAAGDHFSVNTLVWIAELCVCSLNEVAQNRPKLLQPIARETILWPAMISRKRALRQSNNELMDRIQLSAGRTFSGREWHPNAASTRGAFFCLLVAQALERAERLPALTKNTKKQWFESAWNQALKSGFRPEEDERLACLGAPVLGKSSVKRAVRRGMYCQTEGMKRDDMRSEIKRQVWKSFDKLFFPKKK